MFQITSAPSISFRKWYSFNIDHWSPGHRDDLGGGVGRLGLGGWVSELSKRGFADVIIGREGLAEENRKVYLR